MYREFSDLSYFDQMKSCKMDVGPRKKLVYSIKKIANNINGTIDNP